MGFAHKILNTLESPGVLTNQRSSPLIGHHQHTPPAIGHRELITSHGRKQGNIPNRNEELRKKEQVLRRLSK